jgi:hypothetical protein
LILSLNTDISLVDDRLKKLQWSELSPASQEQLLKRILKVSPSRFTQTGAKKMFGNSLVGLLLPSKMIWKSLSPSVQEMLFEITRTWMEHFEPRRKVGLIRE